MSLMSAAPSAQGLVWGAYGEASPAVEKLLVVCAKGMAERRWRAIGARSRAEAVGYFRAALRRRWGCAAAFGAVRVRVRRYPMVGMRRAEATRLAMQEAPHEGAIAFEADEGGAGAEREARDAPLDAWGPGRALA